MWRGWWRRIAGEKAPPAEVFFRRFAGRSLIVHEGLGTYWMEELLKSGGGGGHFRLDLRQSAADPHAPTRWLAECLPPLGLPFPLLILVETDHSVLVRHLHQGAHPCHPAEIPWFIDDMRARERVHVRLRWQRNGGPVVTRPLPPEDNKTETPYGALD